MLCLNRRVGEKILIGNDIEIVVVSIIGGQVKLGVKAPDHLRIDREEVRDKVNAKGREEKD
jgi:carbon storage regulator